MDGCSVGDGGLVCGLVELECGECDSSLVESGAILEGVEVGL